MSTTMASIKDARHIPQILDIIHDCWFDADGIRFEAATSTLSIKFRRESTDSSRHIPVKGFLKKVKIPMMEYVLKIHHVKDYAIDDTEKVGLYDFDELEYDPKLKLVRITGGVPIKIEISVDALEVSVEETHKVLEEKTRLSIL